VARQQGCDQRQQRLQAGGQVDVHVGDHVGVAGAPDLAHGPAPALLGDVDGPDVREPLGQPLGQQPGGVGAGVVGDGDPEREREVGRQVAVEAHDAGLQYPLLVVDRNDDLDQDAGRLGRCRDGGGVGDQGQGAHGGWLLLGRRLHAPMVGPAP